MTAKKSLWVIILVTLLLVPNLWAGDTATFVDLGFSPDGRIYAFAQYGVQAGNLRPWAELYVVDVAQNNFVTGGRLSYIHDSPVVAGQDGSGALYRIITRNLALLERHRVDFLLQGNTLFVSLDDASSQPRQTTEFRDFNSGASYRASLIPRIEGSGANLTSSFHIDLVRTAPDGTRKTYTVGTPSVRRPQISSYRILKAIGSPDGASMIMIIEMKKQNGTNFDIRYMVEALRP
jgi:predicted secreted protein